MDKGIQHDKQIYISIVKKIQLDPANKQDTEVVIDMQEG